MPRDVEKRKAYMANYSKKYRAEHADEKKVNDAIYNIINKEKISAQHRQYYATHKEELSKKASAYYFSNKDRITKTIVEYKLSPLGRATITRGYHRRRDATKATACDLTAGQWATIIAEQGNVCKHCRVVFTLDNLPTKDHIIPVTRGGGLTYSNVQALCQSCNSRKHNRCEDELPYLKVSVSTRTTTTITVTKITDWMDEQTEMEVNK